MTMIFDLFDCPVYKIKLIPAPKWRAYPDKKEAAQLKKKENARVAKIQKRIENGGKLGPTFVYFPKLPPGKYHLSKDKLS